MSERVRFLPKDCLPPHGDRGVPSLTRGDLWFLAVAVAVIFVLWAILG